MSDKVCEHKFDSEFIEDNYVICEKKLLQSRIALQENIIEQAKKLLIADIAVMTSHLTMSHGASIFNSHIYKSEKLLTKIEELENNK